MKEVNERIETQRDIFFEMHMIYNTNELPKNNSSSSLQKSKLDATLINTKNKQT